MQLTLIYNLEAGQGQQSAQELKRLLSRSGHKVRSQNRQSAGFPSAMAEPADMIVVAGGDGTVAKVMRKMPDRRVPLAILPFGTANNIARSFDITGSVEDIVAGWPKGQIRRLDLFEAGGVWGRKRLVEGIGGGALVAGMMRSRGLRGSREQKLATARANIVHVLKRAKPRSWRMEIDGKAVGGEYLFVEFLNLCRVGPGIALSPSAAPSDGKMDIVTLGESDRDAMVDWLERDDGSRPPIRRRTGRCIDLTWDGAPLRVDDDFVTPSGRVTMVRIEHVEQFCRVLVPGPAAARTKKGKR